ncbi:YceI family protein [Roseibium aestuarii]|uniref:YceI family protein n=1 Tax=Roseibium aestuarii TaxID=2600299 RepID=A0ABW4JUY6_9HYPH|nr:YceI family protein [Roseibium aestuarii]
MKTLLLSLAALPFLTTAVLADSWTVDPAKSTLGFEVGQADGAVKGQFQAFEADIDFDPANPGAAKISARIDTLSVATGNRQYDDMLAQPDYFNANTLSVATFETSAVTALGDDRYQAEGTVSIKGIAQPVTLVFTLHIEGDTAHAVGTAELSRSAFDMGASVTPPTLSDAVTVSLDLTASR